MKSKLIIFLFGISLFLLGCEINNQPNQPMVYTSEAPSAEEILKGEKDADIFMLNDTVYKTNIEWVEELNLTKSKKIGEIETNYSFDSEELFKNKMATKLPIGSKIYSVNERNDILIVENEGVEKKYYALTEG